MTSATTLETSTQEGEGAAPASAPVRHRVSAIIPVTRPMPDLRERFAAYRTALDAVADSLEFIFILDGPYPEERAVLETLFEEGESIQVLAFSQRFGEAAALTAGFRYSTGDVIITLPAYTAVEPEDAVRLVESLVDTDVAVGLRQDEPHFESLKVRFLNAALRYLLDSPFHDLGSGVRALRRRVIDEVTIYGEQQMFLPLLAMKHGFSVKELPIRQTDGRTRERARPSMSIARLLDVFTIFFLIKFTKRPFRFFGGFGGALLLVGGLATAWLIIQRLFMGEALADRPALVLSTLTIVLGFQIIAVGLIGEIITFTHAKDMKDYKVDKVVG